MVGTRSVSFNSEISVVSELDTKRYDIPSKSANVYQFPRPFKAEFKLRLIC